MANKIFFSRKAWGIVLIMLFLSCYSYALSYSQEVLADNPISYWRLGETSGTTAVDQKGLNNASYSGSPVLGATGCNPYDSNTAVTFGSTNTQYVVKSAFNSFPGTAISAEFWIKASNTSTSGTPLSYASSTADNEFLIYNYNNVGLYIGGPNVTTGIAINDGQWNHIVVTWRSSDGALKMYKNGANVFSTNHQAGYSIKSGGTLMLAQEQDAVGGALEVTQRLIGSLDEVAIYNTVLSADRVLAHYNSVVIPQPTISVSSNINFGNVLVGTSQSQNITVQNTGASGSTLTGTIGGASSGSEFSPQTGTAINSLSSGASQIRSFTYSPTNRGTDSSNISITSNDSSNPSITRSLTGKGVAAVNQVTTNSIPVTRVGTSSNATVTIQNTGDGNLSGLGEVSNLRGTANTPQGNTAFSGNTANLSLTDGSSQTLNYVYGPTERGADSANVDIHFLNGNSNGTNTSQIVTANLSALAVGPEYTSSVAPEAIIDFGLIEAYSSSQYVLTIQNLTPDADFGDLTSLTLLSASISGQDAGYFSIDNFIANKVLRKGESFGLLLTATNPEWRYLPINATLTILTDQHAAFGSAGQSFTYTLSAVCLPEPSSWLAFIVAILGMGIQYIRKNTIK